MDILYVYTPCKHVRREHTKANVGGGQAVTVTLQTPTIAAQQYLYQILLTPTILLGNSSMKYGGL